VMVKLEVGTILAGGGFKIDKKHGTIHNEDRLLMRISYSDLYLIFKGLE